MHSSLSNIRLAGIAVTTGSVVRDFIADGLAAGVDRVALERTAQTIGLRERRVAAPGVMSQVLTHLIAHLPVGVVVLMRAVREAESVWAGLWVE